jgi:predicted phosphodiesterase
MDLMLKHCRRKVFVLSLFLIIIAIVACQDNHIFRWGTTSPSPVGSTFIVIGDSRSGDSIYTDIVHTITSSLSSSGCLIHVGDMIEGAGHRDQWTHFLQMTAPVATVMPWYAVIGNHDVNSVASQQLYQEVMNLPGNELYYSFDLFDSHFIILDTEVPGAVGGIVGDQLTWLKQELQTYAGSAQYLFVFTHRPVYPQGHYRGHDLANADELHQLFTQYGVDIVFSGHEHQYYTFRKDSVQYVVTGGGGAPIYKGGIGKGFHHFLLVELLPPTNILIHVLDVHGKVIQTESCCDSLNLQGDQNDETRNNFYPADWSSNNNNHGICRTVSQACPR